MNNFKDILEKNIRYQIKKDKTNQIGTLSGSNALLWDDYNFEAESSDHCPRIALLRRVGNIQEEKSIKSFISNNHGRTFENFLRTVLSINLTEDYSIEFQEEEAVEVILEDDKGNKLVTARPDKICKISQKNQITGVLENTIFPIEVKTIQSNSTAYSVFIKEKPKLGALMQLAIYMYGHQIKNGILLYCASNWFFGFAGKTRWSVEPSFKIFNVELKDDGYLYYENNKSIVSISKIIQGSYQFLKHKNNNTLPEIPMWVDINGNAAAYEGCTYCFMNGVCQTRNDFNLEQFFNHAQEVLKNEDTDMENR